MEIAYNPVAGAANTLAPDRTPCISCGYSVDRLEVTALCPECATPVERSVRGDALRYVNPEYVAALARGFRYYYNGLVTAIAISFIGGLTVFLLGGLSSALTNILTVLFPAAAIIAAQVGAYFIATRDPRGDNQTTPIKSREILRNTAVIIVGLSLVQIAFQMTGAMITPSATWIYVVSIANTLAYIAQYFAMVNIIIWLAGKGPNPRFVKRARRDRVVIPCLYITGPLLVAALTLSSLMGIAATGAPLSIALMSLVGLAAMVLMLAGLIMYLSLIRAARAYMLDVKRQQEADAADEQLLAAARR